MKYRNSSYLLASLLATMMITATLLVVSASVEPHPAYPAWPGDAEWGFPVKAAMVTFPTAQDAAWCGAGPTEKTMIDPGHGPAPWVDSGIPLGTYSMVTENSLTAGGSYSYRYELEASGDNDLVITWELENEDNTDQLFVPPDHSVVLENATNSYGSVSINLREEDNYEFTYSTSTGTWVATLYVDNAVNVTISPGSLSGSYGDTLNYTVTVYNNGAYDDTYTLNVTSDNGWPYSIPGSVSVSHGSNQSVTLAVTAQGGNDSFTVEAAGDYATDSASCVAHGPVGPNFEIDISPDSDSGYPGDTLSGFTVEVTNTGSVVDNYDLVITDNAGWDDNVTLSADNLIGVLPGNSGSVTLNVTIPDSAAFTDYTLTVEATSQENDNLSKDDSCTVTVTAPVGVEIISIDPPVDEGMPCENLWYEVTVKNTGEAADNIALDLIDTMGWDPEFAFAVFTVTDNFYPTDDAPVSSYYPTCHNGGDYNVYFGVESSSPYSGDCTGDNTRALFQFDISSIPSGATILSATFHGHGDYGPSSGYPSYIRDNMLTDLKLLGSDSWDESTVCWDNMPSWGATQDTVMILDDNTVSYPRWWTWTVPTSTVQSELSDGAISLGLMSENAEEEYRDVTIWFHTKDSSDNFEFPYLEVKYTYAVSGAPVGPHVVVELPSNGTATIPFFVHVPGSAQPGDESTIVVTATSETENTATDTDTCTAVNGLDIRGVHVEVTPTSQIAHPSVVDTLINPSIHYDPLTYTVAVHNKGIMDDKYELSAWDSDQGRVADWGLKLTPSELFVPAGDTEYASLSVTIPSEVVGCMSHRITVKATGTMADECGAYENMGENVWDTDSAYAVAGKIQSIEVEVLPDNLEPQTGAPGSPLAWLVVIKNTGNVPDEGVLVVDETADWGAELDENTFSLEPGEKATTYLRLVVSEEAKTCDWDNLTVKALVHPLVTESENLMPTDDAYVKDDDIFANFGSSGTLYVGTYYGTLERAFLKYDLSVLTDAFCIDEAILHAHDYNGDSKPPAVGAYGVDSDAWGESSITWANAPWGDVVTRLDVDYVPGYYVETWNEWDVTDFVLKEFIDDGTATILLKSEDEYVKYAMGYDSKESGYAGDNDWDYLEVTYEKFSDGLVNIENYSVRAHAVEPGPRIPEGVIEISVEAQIVAIDVWPVQWEAGILDECEISATTGDHFTVRNTGNVDEIILVRGTDAKSMPGEPVTTWTLASAIGIDTYTMEYMDDSPGTWELLSTTPAPKMTLGPGDEEGFDLKLTAPSVITTPARMWTRVKLTAVEA